MERAMFKGTLKKKHDKVKAVPEEQPAYHEEMKRDPAPKKVLGLFIGTVGGRRILKTEELSELETEELIVNYVDTNSIHFREFPRNDNKIWIESITFVYDEKMIIGNNCVGVFYSTLLKDIYWNSRASAFAPFRPYWSTDIALCDVACYGFYKVPYREFLIAAIGRYTDEELATYFANGEYAVALIKIDVERGIFNGKDRLRTLLLEAAQREIVRGTTLGISYIDWAL